MDPQTRAFLDAITLAKGPSLATLPPLEARAIFSGLTDLFLPETEVAEAMDHCSPGGIPFRMYRPLGAPEEPLPTVLYLHGGGWVMGDVGTHDTLCRHLANAGQIMVASVDYRLSPEHSFPGALEDCQGVLHHLVEEAPNFGIDPKRVGVAGDSAGGNLSAALAIKNRDEQGPPLRAQLLVYPVIDARCDTASYEAFETDHGLSKDEMLYFWRSYLGDIDGAHPLASPNQTLDLSGLPPARVITAEYDILRDEGEAYAEQLRVAGVWVELERYNGVIHGFFHFAGMMDRGREAIEKEARWLGQQLRG
jgi:acetyl esterase